MTRPQLLVLAAVVPLALASVALAAGGRPQLQAFFQSTLKGADYQNKTFARVAKVWRQPGPTQVPALGKKTVVQTLIGKDGNLLSASISTESGSKAWDAAALAAIKKAAPFDRLPPGYALPSVEVHFHLAWVANK